jgi:hypothetical protein
MMNFFSLFLNDSPDVIDDDTRHLHAICVMRERSGGTKSVSQPAFPPVCPREDMHAADTCPIHRVEKKIPQGVRCPFGFF